MSREQARENLKSIGIEEPTDEQITAYLNTVHGESNKEKDKAQKTIDTLKMQADKVSELQKQLDEINNANLSEVDKANKATETANNKIAELESQIEKMKLKASLAEKGIVGEDADKLFDTDGKLDIETLGKIISDREKAAASAKEKEILKDTPNPQGNGGKADGEDEKPADLKMAEKIHFVSTSMDSKDKDYYKL